MTRAGLLIRLLEKGDIPAMAQAFKGLGWNKPAAQYEQYLLEQKLDMRNVYVAFMDGEFAGYVTVCWASNYEPFHEAGIPEIMDFNVLPKFRRRGIGTALMDKAEGDISQVSRVAGLGVGLTPDYGAAQRMYVLRGYVPDGRGLHAKDRHPRYGEQVTVDDDLALYFTKELF